MRVYYRPIVQSDLARTSEAVSLAGTALWFDRVEVIERSGKRRLIAPSDVPSDILERLTSSRADFAGLSMARPKLMGILNATPDSFSDGGKFFDPDRAAAHIKAMEGAGAEIVDIGGESTRPGAQTVAISDEIARITPVIIASRSAGLSAPISVDTRKSDVARAALDAGATIINDVSAFTFDPKMAGLAAERDVPVVLMHAQGDPQTMQNAPQYDDVLLDVYDELEARVDQAVAAGVKRENIAIDPGIGFGKTQSHNLQLIRGLSLFHSLGCPILLGVSRKKFIGSISDQPDASLRGPGSVAVGLEGLRQGVQMLRIHDIEMHHQAVALWKATLGLDAK